MKNTQFKPIRQLPKTICWALLMRYSLHS